MQRIIKFRCWDKLTKVMYGPESLAVMQSERTNMPSASYSNAEWMQFTGLHDRNGVEIFEGDIVSEKKSDCVDVVVFNKGGWWLKPEDDYLFPYDLFVEVIGNIYEHTHLLGKGE